MRRKALCAACLLLAFLLAGAKPYALEERFFRDIQSKKPAVETPVEGRGGGVLHLSHKKNKRRLGHGL